MLLKEGAQWSERKMAATEFRYFFFSGLSMTLSACTVGNEHEDIFTTSDITDTHSESDSAGTQTVTVLTVEDVPTLVPGVLKRREKKYEDIPFLETQVRLSL